MKKIRSQDGTAIAFDQAGNGPAIILVSAAFNERAGGAPLAAVVVSASFASRHGITHGSIPEVTAQLNSYHAGLLVAAGGAALGALIALLGLKIRPEAPSNDQ